MIELFNEYSNLIIVVLPILIIIITIFLLQKKKSFISTHPISLPAILVIFLITYYLSVWFFIDTFSDKQVSLVASLIVGFFTLALSIIINYTQLKSIDLFKALRIKHILRSRSNRKYYYDIINSAHNELWILGVTASRFLDHYANGESLEEIDGNKILIKKIEKGMNVRLLLASLDANKEEKNKRKYADTLERLDKIPKQLRSKIKVEYYDSEPAHSIFYTENECIVGPIFPKVDSEHTPAIHLKNDSPYAKYYLAFFEDAWSVARKNRFARQNMK